MICLVPFIWCLSMWRWYLLRRSKRQPLLFAVRNDSWTPNIYISLKSLHAPANKHASKW